MSSKSALIPLLPFDYPGRLRNEDNARSKHGAALAGKASPAQEGAEREQQKAGLVEADSPKHPGGLIPRVYFEFPKGARIQEIDEVRVVGLSETVDGLANHQVKV
jgi:hypothetical protein